MYVICTLAPRCQLGGPSMEVRGHNAWACSYGVSLSGKIDHNRSISADAQLLLHLRGSRRLRAPHRNILAMVVVDVGVEGCPTASRQFRAETLPCGLDQLLSSVAEL